jgi:site-specific recombinase XerD
MQRIWGRVLRRSGIRREGVILHTLRHSAATLLLQTGTCDILQTQQLLGHSRLDTTAIYLHLAPQGLQAAMRAHPLSGTKATGPGCEQA